LAVVVVYGNRGDFLADRCRLLAQLCAGLGQESHPADASRRIRDRLRRTVRTEGQNRAGGHAIESAVRNDSRGVWSVARDSHGRSGADSNADRPVAKGILSIADATPEQVPRRTHLGLRGYTAPAHLRWGPKIFHQLSS
jgi:hypothetical protein